MNNKKADFLQLCSDGENCRKCPRFIGNRKILSDNNGNLDSPVIIIAQAPGQGANMLGYPLRGDGVGNNFDYILRAIGWERRDIFITNAILCVAQVDQRNVVPDEVEIDNCSEYLKRTIELVNPDVVVTLGEVALNALKNISPHDYVMNETVAQANQWTDKILFPLYLMTDSVLQRHRGMEQQIQDFLDLRGIVDNL